MNDEELTNWLEENSSGVYSPYYFAAQRIKELKTDKEELREAIKELLEVCSGFSIELPHRATPSEIEHNESLKKEHDSAVCRARKAVRIK